MLVDVASVSVFAVISIPRIIVSACVITLVARLVVISAIIIRSIVVVTSIVVPIGVATDVDADARPIIAEAEIDARSGLRLLRGDQRCRQQCGDDEPDSD